MRIMETPGNLEQFFLIWFSDCKPSVKPGFMQLPFFFFFWGNWVLEMSLRTAVIFGAVFLWAFLTIRLRVQRTQSDTFCFLLEFCFSKEVFPYFSNAVITFETTHSYTKSSSSYRAGSMDIPDPLSPLLPIVHRPRLVFRTTSRILT